MKNNSYDIETIVVVEDDSGLNQLLQKRIQQINYKTIGFTKGEEAIEYIIQNQNILLLVDYRLTDMLAIQLIQALREMNIYIPFIVVTGHGDERLAVEMMRLGALDYIVKEIGFYKNIQSIITRVISHYETKKNLEKFQNDLKINEEKYRSIFENIQDIFIETDLNWIISEISPSVEKILFYKREELIEQSFSKLFTNSKEINDLLKLVKKKSHISDFEVILKDKKNKIKYCSATLTLGNNKDGSKKIIGTIRDITLRKKLEKQILSKIIETEEKERKRFSEDLHDGLGPLLASIKIYVNMIITSEELEGETRLNLIRYTNELIDESISNTRSIANNLMPNVLNDYGLVKALNSFCGKINLMEKVEIEFKSNFKKRINDTVEIILYRTILELIHNTLKHANAKHIIIDMNMKKNILKIKYSDDGIGFNLNKTMNKKEDIGQGLSNLINRISSINADYYFKSKKNKGIEINIELNLNNYIND